MKNSFLFSALLLFFFSSYAQQTRYLNDPNETFNQVKDYFQKEQYSLAYPLLKELKNSLRETDRSNQAFTYQEINYYTTVCALKQNEEQAELLAQEFIDVEDNAPRVQMMNYHLAEYYFAREEYTKAIPAYEGVNVANLSNEEVSSQKFHLGYSYFTQKQFAQAKPLFDAVRNDSRSADYKAANYYYGYIAFYDENYAEALKAFRVVENDETYSRYVPYYIATIQYSQGDKKKALDYAKSRVDKGGVTHDNEMRQLVGHALFEDQRYEEAIPYLEAFVNKSDKVSREDMYELSYSYYKTGKLDQAIAGFKQLGGKEDSLAQNAMYMLGDAYLKKGEKANARNAFLFCASNSSNPVQKEISMFHYAKLSYELGYQDIALAEFQKFIDAYPSSSYATEAQDLLIGVLTNTNNYREAMELIRKLGTKSSTARQMYPRILVGRATELVNDGMLVGANELLTQAEKLPENRSVLPYINFWKGEIAFRLNRIDDAIKYLYDYLAAPVVSAEVNPVSARYNLGYAYLRKENYRQALGFFDQVVKNPRINAPAIEQDAYVRIGDCHYMNRDFRRAEAIYDKVIDYSWPSADYATFQKAMIEGINNGRQKISLLNTIARRFPQSPLIPEANMEIASTYLADESYRESIPFLKNVINDPNAALKPRAYLRLGIAQYNLGNNKEALDQYTTLLKQFPNSAEAEEGLENAKAIFVEEGRSGEYVNFARSMGQEVTSSQEDDLAYEEAEVQFNNGNFPAAAKEFEEYLAEFPEGKRSLEALYYKSEIYLNRKEMQKAAEGYEKLADRVPHKFGEKSLVQAARINFFDLKNYEKSEQYFTKLKEFASTEENRMEAMRGLLRSQYQLKKWNEAVPNAQELLEKKGAGTDDRILSNMVLGKSYQENGECEKAITNYRAVAGLSKAAYGAEARFQIASCFFSQQRYKDAEKAAFEVIDKSGSYEEYITRAYLLLGDIYFQQKDYFNAKATFQSVVDNAKIEELRREAETKLQNTIAEEQKNSKIEN